MLPKVKPSAVPPNLREVSGCLCLRLRKTTRRLTQIYDEALSPARVTVTQFGILANLAGRGTLRIGDLAEHLGMDPTSLNRTLKPLLREGWIAEKSHPEDRRVRLIEITAQGSRRLTDAMVRWESVQGRMVAALGQESANALRTSLDLAGAVEV